MIRCWQNHYIITKSRENIIGRGRKRNISIEFDKEKEKLFDIIPENSHSISIEKKHFSPNCASTSTSNHFERITRKKPYVNKGNRGTTLESIDKTLCPTGIMHYAVMKVSLGRMGKWCCARHRTKTFIQIVNYGGVNVKSWGSFSSSCLCRRKHHRRSV